MIPKMPQHDVDLSRSKSCQQGWENRISIIGLRWKFMHPQRWNVRTTLNFRVIFHDCEGKVVDIECTTYDIEKL